MNKLFKNRNDFRLIIAYIQEKVTAVERKDVEDALKHDAFLREAKEGFSGIKVSDVMSDIAEIDSMLGNKKKQALSVYIYLLIIAVLIVFSVFLFKNSSTKKLLEPIESEMTFVEEIVKDSLFFESEGKASGINSESSIIPENIVEPDEIEDTRTDTGESNVALKKTVIIDDSEPEKKTIKKEQAIVNVDIADKTNTEKMDATLQYIEKKIEISKQALIPEKIDNYSVAENDLGLAINEANSTDNELLSPDYSAKATPVGGFLEFDKYIYENLVYPETEERQRRQVVRISFEVGIHGELRDFTVLKAPDNQDFGKEAIRLIKEGPQWTPAFDNGMSFEEKVTVRIVFRP